MKGFLVLETGEIFEGLWHGGNSRAGEVVFNTSHSGYEEIATDPSYFSQIVVMTAPMQGNYSADHKFWESQKIHIEGFICVKIQDSRRDQLWLKTLLNNKVPVVSEIDTRRLVLRLRSGGTPWGALVQAESKEQAQSQALALIIEKKKISKDWVYLTSRSKTEVRHGKLPLGPRVAVLDFGTKENILREIESWTSEIKIFNSRSTVEQILAHKPQALILTNGPGDPSDVQVAPETVRTLLGKIPMLGICMGHQILCLAMGAKTYKLKFGHRGSNHPIQDRLLKKVYVTSQNHGYAVDEKTLPKGVLVTQVNLNDNTVAGVYDESKKCLGIQYHPEACPGPHEARELFQYFFERIV